MYLMRGDGRMKNGKDRPTSQPHTHLPSHHPTLLPLSSPPIPSPHYDRGTGGWPWTCCTTCARRACAPITTPTRYVRSCVYGHGRVMGREEEKEGQTAERKRSLASHRITSHQPSFSFHINHTTFNFTTSQHIILISQTNTRPPWPPASAPSPHLTSPQPPSQQPHNHTTTNLTTSHLITSHQSYRPPWPPASARGSGSACSPSSNAWRGTGTAAPTSRPMRSSCRPAYGPRPGGGCR